MNWSCALKARGKKSRKRRQLSTRRRGLILTAKAPPFPDRSRSFLLHDRKRSSARSTLAWASVHSVFSGNRHAQRPRRSVHWIPRFPPLAHGSVEKLASASPWSFEPGLLRDFVWARAFELTRVGGPMPVPSMASTARK